jgi:signal transduction histidine kinase
VFAQSLADLLRQSLGASAPPQQLLDLVELGLMRSFKLPGELPSRIQNAELDSLTERAIWRGLSAGLAELDVQRYAAANQLVVRRANQQAVSPLGLVLQQLEGRDALRWLLCVEAQQALGNYDSDRLSYEGAAQMLARDDWSPYEYDPYEDEHALFHKNTLRRLTEFSILDESDPEPTGATRWRVSPLGKELLQELVQQTKTPLALLAESLRTDLVSSVVHHVTGEPIAAHSSAAEATASQARLVAHEVRNALLPVQAALDSLYREVLVLPPAVALEKRRSRIDLGIKNALQFTKELLQTAELGAKPPERFEPVAAVREVLEELAVTTQVSLHGPSIDSLPLLLGRRKQFALAIRNLVANALQHGGTKVRRVQVAMALDVDQSAIRLTIDDDGCGIDDSQRERIFHHGVTNHPGSTGQGLSMVKTVFEEELQGVVVCTQSPLGGAQFAIRLPISARAVPRSPKEIKR